MVVIVVPSTLDDRKHSLDLGDRAHWQNTCPVTELYYFACRTAVSRFNGGNDTCIIDYGETRSSFGL